MAPNPYIQSVRGLFGTKTVVRGTRLKVEFLGGLLERGWTHQQILENFPSLTPESLQAVVEYLDAPSHPR